jgi:hypothetical protein
VDASAGAESSEDVAEAVEPVAPRGTTDSPDATPDVPQGALAGLDPLSGRPPDRCPPDPRPAHCILLELDDPGVAHVAALVARLREEGLDAGPEGETVAIRMDEAAIERVFAARVVYHASAASATFDTLCEATLEGGRVPRPWRDLVHGFAIGHQICE